MILLSFWNKRDLALTLRGIPTTAPVLDLQIILEKPIARGRVILPAWSFHLSFLPEWKRVGGRRSPCLGVTLSRQGYSMERRGMGHPVLGMGGQSTYPVAPGSTDPFRSLPWSDKHVWKHYLTLVLRMWSVKINLFEFKIYYDDYYWWQTKTVFVWIHAWKEFGDFCCQSCLYRSLV